MKGKLSLSKRINISLSILTGKTNRNGVIFEKCQFCDSHLFNIKKITTVGNKQLESNQYASIYECKKCGAIGINSETWYRNWEEFDTTRR